MMLLFSQVWQQFQCSFEYNEDFLIMLFKHAYASQFGKFFVLACVDIRPSQRRMYLFAVMCVIYNCGVCFA